MKLSTRTRYGLRFLTYLGIKYGEGFVQLKEIAAEEAISLKYLEQIVRLLKSSGFITVQRGPQGGYALQQVPQQISLDKVFLILEGTISPTECLSAGCKRKEFCYTVPVWEGLDKVIVEYLKSYTVADLVLDYKKKSPQAMFYI